MIKADMRKDRMMRRLAAASAAILVLGSSTLAAETMPLAPAVVVTPLTSADVNAAGQLIVFPQRNGHVAAAIYEVPPGAVLPTHKHPFQRLGYVLSGTLRVTNEEQGTSATYRSGDFVLESVNVWHRGENIVTDRLRLLVIDLSEKGAANTILKR